MKATLVVSPTVKVRTQSQRRYIVLASQIIEGRVVSAWIALRTDSLAKAATKRALSHSTRFVFDTVDGSCVTAPPGVVVPPIS